MAMTTHSPSGSIAAEASIWSSANAGCVMVVPAALACQTSWPPRSKVTRCDSFRQVVHPELPCE